MQTKTLIKGWLLLSAGALAIASAGGLLFGLPAALAISGVWVIIYGISVLSGCGIGECR